MSRLQALQQYADRLQRRHSWLAFPVAAWKKFSDDRAGYLAALIAYYAFVSLFPLFLALVTILDLVLASHETFREHIVNSALASYPVIGQQLKSNVHALSSTGPALAIGLIGTLFGARGLATATQNALNTAWAVPFHRRPAFGRSLLRSIGLIAVVGPCELATLVLSGLSGGAGHLLGGVLARTAAIVVSLVLNVGVFWLAFRLAAASQVSARTMLLGAVIAATAWQALQIIGGYLVSHQLARYSTFYGVFAIVLGLLAWLFLQAQFTMYAVEINVVRAYGLWPRSVIRPRFVPSDQLTEADMRAYRLYAQAEQRMPDVGVRLEVRDRQDP
jgi:YihY family inner membrane protein